MTATPREGGGVAEEVEATGRTPRHSRINSQHWLNFVQEIETQTHESGSDGGERDASLVRQASVTIGPFADVRVPRTETLRGNQTHEVMVNESLPLNARDSATTQLADRKKEFRIILFILTPAIVTTFVLLAINWTEWPRCSAPLRTWCLVEAIRLLVSVTLSWILQRNVERTPQHMAWLDSVGRVVSFFSLSWFVIGQIWLMEGVGTCQRSPQLVHLTAALIILQYTLMLLPVIVLLVLMPFLCLCLPCIIQGFFFFNKAPVRGASKREINRLPTEKFSKVDFAEKGYDESCSICLADFEASEIARILHCRHVYHKECIDSWLTLNGTCPICRSAVSRKHATALERENSRVSSSQSSDSSSEASPSSNLENQDSFSSTNESSAAPTAGDRVAAQSVLYRRLFSFRSLFARQRGLPTIRTPGEPLSSLRNLRDEVDAAANRRRSAEGPAVLLDNSNGGTHQNATSNAPSSVLTQL